MHRGVSEAHTHMYVYIYIELLQETFHIYIYIHVMYIYIYAHTCILLSIEREIERDIEIERGCKLACQVVGLGFRGGSLKDPRNHICCRFWNQSMSVANFAQVSESLDVEFASWSKIICRTVYCWHTHAWGAGCRLTDCLYGLFESFQYSLALTMSTLNSRIRQFIQTTIWLLACKASMPLT